MPAPRATATGSRDLEFFLRHIVRDDGSLFEPWLSHGDESQLDTPAGRIDSRRLKKAAYPHGFHKDPMHDGESRLSRPLP